MYYLQEENLLKMHLILQVLKILEKPPSLHSSVLHCAESKLNEVSF